MSCSSPCLFYARAREREELEIVTDERRARIKRLAVPAGRPTRICRVRVQIHQDLFVPVGI